MNNNLKQSSYDYITFRNTNNVKINFMDRPQGISTRLDDNYIHPSLSQENDISIKQIQQQQQVQQHQVQQTKKTSNTGSNTGSKLQNMSMNLFRNIQSKFPKFKHITESDLDYLLQKKKWDWAKNGIQEFVKELRLFNNEKLTFHNKLSQIESTITYDYKEALKTFKNNPKQETKMIHPEYIKPPEIINNKTIIDKTNDLYDKYKETFMINTHKITINSFDRNRDTYPEPNNFKINIFNKTGNNPDTVGVIYKNLSNIIKISLDSIIIPKYSEIEGTIDNYPYLILEIPELRSNTSNATNKYLNNSLGKIFFDTNCGLYKMSDLVKNKIEKEFTIPINITSMTIILRKPNGDIFNFGNTIVKKKHSEESDNIKPEICLDFTISTKQIKKTHALHLL